MFVTAEDARKKSIERNELILKELLEDQKDSVAIQIKEAVFSGQLFTSVDFENTETLNIIMKKIADELISFGYNSSIEDYGQDKSLLIDWMEK